MTTADVDIPRHSIVGDRRFKYGIIAPAIFVLLLVGLFPILYSAVVSFQNITMLDTDTSWYGFGHYARLFRDSRLWGSILHTAVITVIALPLELFLGLLMAQLFLDKMPGKQIFVAFLLIPTIVSPIVAGSMWRLMFDDRFGPINQIIKAVVGWFGGEYEPILWIVKSQWVYPAIIITEVWEWTPFMFLILLAALSNVNRDLVEAAEIDGASFWQIFVNISLPAIWPVMIIALIIRALDLVRLFDIVWQITRGGPGNLTETISIYMYLRGFQQFDTSYTGAMIFLTVLLLSVIVIFALRRVEIAR